MLFFLLKHYLELNITDTALKVSRSLYCVTTSISHGVETISPGCGVRALLEKTPGHCAEYGSHIRTFGGLVLNIRTFHL